jgi:LacI family transcriptional regulator
VVEALLDNGVPFILIGRHPTNNTVHYIDVDNQTAAAEAVAHLLRLGRRRVATISGPQNMIAGADRLTGYLNGLRERGMTTDPALITEGDFTEAGGYMAMQRLLPRKPDAVFVASDAMAVGALRAIREADLRVPEDIAVVGFDDMPFATRSNPPLTTVRQPVLRTGSVAAETLIDLIDHPDSPTRRIVLPTEFVVRTSCGSALM